MEDDPYENTVASSPQQKKGEKFVDFLVKGGFILFL